MAKIQPSEKLLQAVRDVGTSILGTWSERRAAEERMLALLVEESGGSAWKESRLNNMAYGIVLNELNEESLRRLEEERKQS